MSDETSLYRWFDYDNVPLYIGVTKDLLQRQVAHSASSIWTKFADRATVQRYPNREVALAAEEAAIRSEMPIFNVQFNDTPAAVARLIDYLCSHGRPDLLHALHPGRQWSHEEEIDREFARVGELVKASKPGMRVSVTSNFDADALPGLFVYARFDDLRRGEWAAELMALQVGSKIWLHDYWRGAGDFGDLPVSLSSSVTTALPKRLAETVIAMSPDIRKRCELHEQEACRDGAEEEQASRQPSRNERAIPAIVQLISENLVGTVAAALDAEGIPFEVRERVTRRLLLTEREREAHG